MNNQSKSFGSLSNVPVNNTERYGYYADMLAEKVKEENVNNIGIIAPYGAGKSSLINTYKEKYELKKTVTISLANFTSVDQGEEKANNNVNDIERGQVEKSILEQLLFSVRKKDVPESKLNRIRPCDRFKKALLVLSLVMSVAFIFLTIFEWKNALPNSAGKNFLLFFALSMIFLFLLFLLVFDAYSVKKISIKEIETESEG